MSQVILASLSLSLSFLINHLCHIQQGLVNLSLDQIILKMALNGKMKQHLLVVIQVHILDFFLDISECFKSLLNGISVCVGAQYREDGASAVEGTNLIFFIILLIGGSKDQGIVVLHA